jgi:hypothetical protein
VLLEEVRSRVPKMDGSPLDLAGGQIVSSSENLHGKILRATAVTRVRRHDDNACRGRGARDCLRLMAAMAFLLLPPPGSEGHIMKVFGTSSPVST